MDELARVPKEIEDMDPIMIEMYLKALKEGKETPNTIRVMIVGHCGVGKTTLSRNLMQVPLDGLDSTNGIDVHKCSSSVNAEWKQVELTKTDELDRLAVAAHLTLHTEDSQNKVEEEDEIIYEEKEEKEEKEKEEEANEEDNTLVMNERINQTTRESSAPSLPKDTAPSIPKDTVQQFASRFQSCNYTSDQEKMINIWDFGGQFIFYATHQLFHSRNAIYLLVMDLSQKLDTPVLDDSFPDSKRSVASFCKFWMHSIHSYVGNREGEPPVVLVGTHYDELEGDEDMKSKVAEDYFKKVRDLVYNTPVLNHIRKKTFPVDKSSPVDNLRTYICSLAAKKSSNEEIPAKWIPLEKSLIKRKNEKHITFDEVCQIDAQNTVPIKDEVQIRTLFLAYHHKLGSIVYFDEEGLSGLVVLDPQWIIDAFKCIVTSEKFCEIRPKVRPLWDKLVNEAILVPELIKKVWKDDKKNDFFEHREVLLLYMKKLGIISNVSMFDLESEEVQDRDYFIVPSFLKNDSSKDEEVNDLLNSSKGTTTSLVYAFANEFVSPTLYHHITAAALGTLSVVQIKGKHLLFQNMGVYKMDINHVGLIEVTDTTIEIRVANICKETVDSRYTDRLRRFVEMVLKHECGKFKSENVQYKKYIRCKTGSRCGQQSIEIESLNTDYAKIRCPDFNDHVIEVKTANEQWCQDMLTSTPTNKDVNSKSFSRFLSSEILDRKPTSREMSKISQNIGDNWELLGTSLKLSNATIGQIKQDNQTCAMRIYNMLNTWVNIDDEKATLAVLFQEMEDNPEVANRVNWDGIKNMFDFAR